MLLKSRDRTYERIIAAGNVDTDADGVPDLYER